MCTSNGVNKAIGQGFMLIQKGKEENLSLLEDYWKYVLVYVTLHKCSTLFCMAKDAIVSILICKLFYHICKSLGFI